MNSRRALALIATIATAISLLVPAALAPSAAAATVSRIAGADRYDTAAQIVQRFFASPVDTVFVASGESPIDALAGVPAAGVHGAPLLLVRPDSVPLQTRAELARLAPKRVVVLGGESVISRSVAEAVGDYADSLTRFGGVDRHATALQISNATFPDGAGTVYVAAGDRPADALSAGAVAAAGKMPLLLISSGGIPPEVRAEVDRLNPVNIVVLGGATAIPEAIAGELAQYASGGVVRFGGQDRYDTSAEVSRLSIAAPRPLAVLASGVDFIDALAAGASAATVGAPVLLAQPTCMADSVRAELARLAPTDVVVAGGSASLSDAAVGGAACPPPAPVRPPSPYSPPPANSGDGRRIVYSNSGQRVWLVEDDGYVTRSYLVSGRAGMPRAGTYHVFSKSRYTTSGSVSMEWMVRFAWGTSLAIGFHSIPVDRYGRPIQSERLLGTYQSSGCVRQARRDAAFLWDWAPVGTKVVVLR